MVTQQHKFSSQVFWEEVKFVITVYSSNYGLNPHSGTQPLPHQSGKQALWNKGCKKPSVTFQQPVSSKHVISFTLMIPASFLCGFGVHMLTKYGVCGTLHEFPLSSFVRQHANQSQKKSMTTLWRSLLFLKALNQMTIYSLQWWGKNLPPAGKHFILSSVDTDEMAGLLCFSFLGRDVY